ncbi:MAG TPA: hypothetical protein DCP06_06915 [Lachnospiraceae bacterium]|nr:hypothetical protein [Lachnospiraceae bacterium]
MDDPKRELDEEELDNVVGGVTVKGKSFNQCQVCGKVFDTRKELLSHMKKKHDMDSST